MNSFRKPGESVPESLTGIHTIVGDSSSETAFVDYFSRGPVNQAVRIESAAEFNQSFGGLDPRSEASYGISQYFRNGGQTAWVVRILASDSLPGSAAWIQSEGARALLGSGEPSGGIYALRGTSFSILCVPCTAMLSALSIKSFYTSAAQFCEDQRAFLIADIAQDQKDPGPSGVQKWVTDSLPTDRNVAVYFPRIFIPDPLAGGQMRDTAPSGAVAGVFARIDSTHGVWKAASGNSAVIEDVDSLVVRINDADGAALNRMGINALRNFPGSGNVVWGARTLAGADVAGSEWKYIPVRRMALFLERTINNGLTWAAFEPNGESLWAKIRLSIGAFLLTLFRNGAFQGAVARDAYFIKCDQSTTSQDDINRGVVNVVVGFAPLKPAEFVVLKIEQQAMQVSP